MITWRSCTSLLAGCPQPPTVYSPVDSGLSWDYRVTPTGVTGKTGIGRILLQNDRIIETGGRVTVPAGRFDNCLLISGQGMLPSIDASFSVSTSFMPGKPGGTHPVSAWSSANGANRPVPEDSTAAWSRR